MHLKRLAAVLATVLGGGLVAGPALAAKPPSSFSLAGENFHEASGATVSCTNGTLSFSASGIANGPILGLGTFTESGTATGVPAVFGAVSSFNASFTIFNTSGGAIVTGTKTLVMGVGVCPTTGLSTVGVLTDYTAQFGHHKKLTDSGNAQVNLDSAGFFNEGFRGR